MPASGKGEGVRETSVPATDKSAVALLVAKADFVPG
jgi:hypothetical protein